jgi:Flp pilus assembly pilin Flp
MMDTRTRTDGLRDRLLLAYCWLQALGAEGGAWLGARQRGQGTVEYTLVAAGIAVLALAVIGVLSGAVTKAADSAAQAVTQAASGAASGTGK